MTGGAPWRKFRTASGLFLVRSWEADPEIDRRPHHEAHLTWLEEGHESGRILLSGPSRDRTLGIYVVQARSVDEARGYVASDPYHEIGLREFDVVEWEIQRRSMVPGLVADTPPPSDPSASHSQQ